MDIRLFTQIVPEVREAVRGQRFGRVFQLSRSEFAIDLRLPSSRYLFISIEPANPRIYLIVRRLRDLEKASVNSGSFALRAKKLLAGLSVLDLRQVEDERIAILELSGRDDTGSLVNFSFVAQLTGRSSNLFITDLNGAIVDRVRDTSGEGQMIGDLYAPPTRAGGSTPRPDKKAHDPSAGSLSELLDREYLDAAQARRFNELAIAARQRIGREIAKRSKLLHNLKSDLAEHGDAEKWKRFGDTLLANVGTAVRIDGGFSVADYFEDGSPQVVIPAEENESVTETAERYFKRYTKARNASGEIARRIADVERELARLEDDRERLEEAIEQKDFDFLGTGSEEIPGRRRPQGAKKAETDGYARKFISSDGFEILVGKKAKDNDHLTFRVARSLDTWMHAADYPGSHVVIRNQNKKEIPQRTMLEAAQLAAFYSQGKKQPKAAVHYTLKKFVNKPKGSAPGLVSLSSFKTLLVEPSVPAITRV